ncbi:MAG: hypothetical protein QM736_15715 [Vicinamibacterales bacterium]
MPPNSYWRWPYWDIQNVSFLTTTQLGTASYLKTRLYRNSFKNGLDAYDDATYTTQSANGRFRARTTTTRRASAPRSARRADGPTR